MIVIDENNAERFLAEALNPALERAAQVYADRLRENLREGYRSGVLRPPQKVASAEGEYPQEQTGELRRSVGAIQARDFEAWWGYLLEAPRYAVMIELKDPAQGGRPAIHMTSIDPETRVLANGALNLP